MKDKASILLDLNEHTPAVEPLLGISRIKRINNYRSEGISSLLDHPPVPAPNNHQPQGSTTGRWISTRLKTSRSSHTGVSRCARLTDPRLLPRVIVGYSSPPATNTRRPPSGPNGYTKKLRSTSFPRQTIWILNPDFLL